MGPAQPPPRIKCPSSSWPQLVGSSRSHYHHEGSLWDTQARCVTAGQDKHTFASSQSTLLACVQSSLWYTQASNKHS